MNKRELLTLTVSVLISLSIFAQKSELKTAEKAVKKKEYSLALATNSFNVSWSFGIGKLSIQNKFLFKSS